MTYLGLSPNAYGLMGAFHQLGGCKEVGRLPGGLDSKESACDAGNARDKGSIPGSGRSPGERNGNPLQYSCLGSPMDKVAWRVAAHRVAKSETLTD